MSFKSITFIIN